MNRYDRRGALRLLAAVPLLFRVTAAWGDPKDRPEAKTDWSRSVVENMMALKPDPAALGRWGYAVSLYLYGQYLVFKRTGERRYFDYMRGWVDSHVDEQGKIDHTINALDYMLPGNLLLVLHKETGEAKYRIAADTIRHTFDTYPRTQDGGLWHAYTRQHQLWLDGMYMSMPFLVRYGAMYNESAYTVDEAVTQLLIYARHLNDPSTGLMFHAYDESGAQKWADPVTHHSAVRWCRAIGWFGMALIEVLEVMPEAHPQRKHLISLVRQLCNAYRHYQDPATGLWYQVVDRGADPRNWLETSSSSMFTYTLSRASERRYISRRLGGTARKGYRGVLTQLSLDESGHAHIANICRGTNVGDLDYYYARPRSTDDFHGIGAFLIMNEQIVRKAL